MSGPLRAARAPVATGTGLGLLVLAALILAAVAPAGAAAQEIVGMAVDADDRPLPEVPVALHRVGGGSGATVATGVTDADGRFRFAIEAADSAVYFVAIRHGEGMYIGPPARAGAGRVTDYVVRADPASEAGAIASALSGARRPGPLPGAARPARSGGGEAAAIALVALLALAVAAVFLATAPGYRRRQRRGLLIELARIDNRLDADPEAARAAEDRRRRAALLDRLAPRS